MLPVQKLAQDYAVSAGKSTDTYKTGKGYYNTGKGYYDTGKRYYDTAEELASVNHVGEQYSGAYWSESVASDSSMQALREALDASAAAGESTRKERENATRSKSAEYGKLASTYGGIFGAAFAVALWAFTEGAIYLSKLWGNEGDSGAERERAVANVQELWNKWRVAPPSYQADIYSARDYANVVRGYIDNLDATETSDAPWRARWVACVDAALNDTSNIVRDAALMGWFPIRYERWCLLGWSTMYKGEDGRFHNVQNPGISIFALPAGTGWQQGVLIGKESKAGFLSAERDVGERYYTTPDLRGMQQATDPMAAGIGIMVAAYTKKSWEPLIEEAVRENTRYAEEIGPSPHVQNWRLKGVFLETLNEASRVQSRVPDPIMFVDPGLFGDSEPDRESLQEPTRASAVVTVGLPAAAGVAAGFVFGGPIGIAVGAVSWLLTSWLTSD